MSTSTKRLLSAVFAVFFIVYVATAIISGDGSFVLAVVLVVLFVLVAVAAFGLGRRRLERRHDGDPHRAVADHTDPIPSAPLIPDDDTALGDTTEAHDEITPHDLPVGHPGRARAEELAGHPAATTRGDT